LIIPRRSGYGPAVSSGVVTQPLTVEAPVVVLELGVTLVVEELLDDPDVVALAAVGDPPQRDASTAPENPSSSSALLRVKVFELIVAP
jgi:hypothetical protein